MLNEPQNKRAVAFFDGQNLFHAAKEAFGYRFPNFDALKLAQGVCEAKGWTLAEVRFYTGVPDRNDNAAWSHFWTAKLARMGLVALAHRGAYDVAIVFSQDQDLTEAADELRAIAREQGRWIKIASAYPFSPTSRNRRGINGTDWIRIERSLYDQCLDSRDYRPKKAP